MVVVDDVVLDAGHHSGVDADEDSDKGCHGTREAGHGGFAQG